MFRCQVALFITCLMSKSILSSLQDPWLRVFSQSTLSSNSVNELNLTIKDADSARFFILGDWGGMDWLPYMTFVQTRTSMSMASVANKLQTHFQLSTGDNFYTSGVKNTSDTRFSSTFEEVYSDERLKSTPWFQVLGNHDHLGNSSAQIKYSQHSKRWILPSYNYVVNVNVDKLNMIKLIIIDTVLLCGNVQDTKQPRFKSKRAKLRSSKYFDWVEKQLRIASTSNYRYLAVVGHYPIWSVAEHGPTECLVKKLRPLLFKYQVNAYFCGHEHDMEHIKETGDNNTSVEYIVSGAGSSVWYSKENANRLSKEAKLQFYWASDFEINGAYALVDASFDNMTIRFIQSNNQVLYTTTVTPFERK